MFAKLMRRLGWVRREEHQKLLLQHVTLLDEHEKMIRLAQALLRQNDGEPAAAEGAGEAEPPAAPTRPTKLH